MTFYEQMEKHEKEMLEELERVKNLLATRGIYERKPDEEFDRVVSVKNHCDYGCIIKSTCFKIPAGIDIEKVVWWFVHGTKYYDCTVFMHGHPYTTIYNDSGIRYFFKRTSESERLGFEKKEG